MSLSDIAAVTRNANDDGKVVVDLNAADRTTTTTPAETSTTS